MQVAGYVGSNCEICVEKNLLECFEMCVCSYTGILIYRKNLL